MDVFWVLLVVGLFLLTFGLISVCDPGERNR